MAEQNLLLLKPTIREHLKKWSTARLVRGRTDCLAFAGEWVTSQGGPDIYTPWRYANEFGAWRCLFRNGFNSVEEYLDAVLVRCRPTDGCVIACVSHTRMPALGIWHAGKAWIFVEGDKIGGTEAQIIGAWTWLPE